MFSEDILKNCGEPDFTVTATSSSTGGYTFYSSDPSVVSVDESGTATINSSGITIINVVQSAGVNYNSSTASFTITVNKLNTDKINPLTSIINSSLKSRIDEVKEGKIRDQILKNSPESNDEFFVVPKVIE